MLQGTIVHQTLSEWHLNPQPIEPLFERIFAENCAQKRVFMGYRTEYLRRQMLDDLLVCEREIAGLWKFLPSTFEMAVDDSPGARTHRRIDRRPMAVLSSSIISARQRRREDG
jgi:hypothetical protein